MSLKDWGIYPPYFIISMSFKLIDNLKFVNVDTNFLKQLHSISSEVYYKESDYQSKPYLGILLSSENFKYVIPLTSAKEKHKYWKVLDNDKLLVYAKIKKNQLHEKDIWIKSPFNDAENDDVLHIFSAIDLKKMIPVIDSAIKVVNINYNENDTIKEKNYKDLLQNEYSFCISIIDSIIARANNVYNKQVTKKNGLKFCCDFKALEDFITSLNYTK